MRPSLVARVFGIGFILTLAGCGKVPTWGELTGGQPAAPAPNQVAVVPPKPVVVPVQVSPPAGPTPEEMVAKFQDMRAAEISDSSIQQLASTPDAAAQITEINADGSKLTSEAFNQIENFPNLRQLRLSNTQINDAACAKIAMVTTLEVLALTSTTVGDVGVAALSGLPNLKQLELSQCKLSDNGYAAIGNLPALKTLIIESTNLDGRKLNLLCEAKTLTHLYISRNQLNDEALVGLKKLTNLEALEVNDTQVTGYGFGAAIKGGGLKNLTILGVYACPLNDVGAKAISRMTSLEKLNIGSINVMQDAGFANIVSGMKKLKWVNITNCNNLDGSGLFALKGCTDMEELHMGQCSHIGDGVVKLLKGFKNLKKLTVSGTAITPNGIAEIKSVLPDLIIY